MVDRTNENERFRRITAACIMAIVITLCIPLLHGCKHGPTGPEPRNPRGYAWSMDTLLLDPIKYPGAPYQNLMESFYGDATDLYAVGWTDGSAGTMWHFDGRAWTNVTLGDFEGGTIPAPYNLQDIKGLGPNNIFAAGGRVVSDNHGASFIIHYDGKQWKEQQTPSGSRLLSVWPNGENDVWACGLRGTLFHFNGVQWMKDSVAVTVPAGADFCLNSIARSSTGDMLMVGSAWVTTPPNPLVYTHYFFRREAGKWVVADSFVVPGGLPGGKWGSEKLVVLPTGSVYSLDRWGLFRWDGTTWIRRYGDMNILVGVFGTDDDNLFLGGYHGFLAHYNGRDWYQFANLARENVVYAGGWADDWQAHCVGWIDGMMTEELWGK
jgi:hypothetical protein